MTNARACSVCGESITPRNALGICKRYPACIAARDKIRNAGKSRVAPLCQGCGKPLTKLRIEQKKRKCGPCDQKAKNASKARTHQYGIGKRFGLVPGEYDALYVMQGGRCAICARATGKARRLSVDHDHKKEGRSSVRGLLCRPCNNMLGNARDNPEFFRRAIDYLLHPPAPTEIKFGTKPDEYLIRYGESEWMVIRRLKDDELARGPGPIEVGPLWGTRSLSSRMAIWRSTAMVWVLGSAGI